MAKRSKSQRLSSLLNVAGFIVDGYNGYKYHAKIKISISFIRFKHCRNRVRLLHFN